MGDLIVNDLIVKHGRAYRLATGRVSAADRNLSELLHPSMAAGLTPEQREKVITARKLIRSIQPAVRDLAGVNHAPPADETVPGSFAPTTLTNVIDLRTRAARPV